MVGHGVVDSRRTFDVRLIRSATCLNQLVLHWAERADFPVVLEGYAGRAEHCIGPGLANIVLSGAVFS